VALLNLSYFGVEFAANGTAHFVPLCFPKEERSGVAFVSIERVLTD
jgi:hypothetical protein